jgi:ZIP family zinc transporter
MLSSVEILALSFTLFAGLATTIGAGLAFFVTRTNYRFLSVSLSFSAGVMLYVSFVEILRKAETSLQNSYGESAAAWLATAGFFVGIIFIAVIDRFVPSPDNPHEPPSPQDLDALSQSSPPQNLSKLHRTGIFTALAIAIHNFPEGLATFIATLDDPSVGAAIAIAIALHNIPEGVAVSIPIYYATGSKWKAFWLASFSGLAEPIGALVGYMLLSHFLSPAAMGFTFASVAGIMVFICLDELLPTARQYAKGHETLYGIVTGMAVMALSLLLLK